MVYAKLDRLVSSLRGGSQFLGEGVALWPDAQSSHQRLMDSPRSITLLRNIPGLVEQLSARPCRV